MMCPHGGDDALLARGKTPRRYECAASTFGSLIVIHVSQRSPRARTIVVEWRRSRSGRSRARSPPRSAIHCGSEKWWSVTIGAIPAVAKRPEDRAVAVERAVVELTRPRLDACPLDRQAMRVSSERLLQRHVLCEPVPPVARHVGAVAVLDPSGLA